MNDLITAKKIAQLAAEKGGRAFYVGGFVRDRQLGLTSNDIDIEVHGIAPEVLHEILASIGDPLAFGESFGIWSLRGTGLDIAMPRREHATGRGHRDFAVSVDPFIGPEAAARRRDFTINALMEDVLTGQILDFFGGLSDLSKGVIRHIDPKTFVEDPLRVLRAAQFAARFEIADETHKAGFSSSACTEKDMCLNGETAAALTDLGVQHSCRRIRYFAVAPDTVELCKTIDLSPLSRERVFGEMQKALLKSSKPSVFFETLRAMDQLNFWFPELKSLMGIAQDPIFHPEGDVWVHTMEVIDRAAELVGRYAGTEEESVQFEQAGVFNDSENSVSGTVEALPAFPRIQNPLAFMFLALTHDFGKITASEVVNGRVHAYGHEIAGLPIIETFLHRLTNQNQLIKYVLNMVPLHMKPNVACHSKPSVKSTNHMFDEAAAPADLIYFAMADKPVVVPKDRPQVSPKACPQVSPKDRLEVSSQVSPKDSPQADLKVNSKDSSQSRLQTGAAAGLLLVPCADATKPVVPFAADYQFLFDRLVIYEETMARPFVSGKDLICAGIRPGSRFKEALAFAHKLRLAGIDKQSALKQTLGQFRKK